MSDMEFSIYAVCREGAKEYLYAMAIIIMNPCLLRNIRTQVFT